MIAMSVESLERDELRHLVERIPDSQVASALAELRRQFDVPKNSSWPPAWFGAAISKDGRTDVSQRVDDLLAEGFGQ
jgi:hypothetical protein